MSSENFYSGPGEAKVREKRHPAGCDRLPKGVQKALISFRIIFD
jgi:hypothetical protein